MKKLILFLGFLIIVMAVMAQNVAINLDNKDNFGHLTADSIAVDIIKANDSVYILIRDSLVVDDDFTVTGSGTFDSISVLEKSSFADDIHMVANKKIYFDASGNLRVMSNGTSIQFFNISGSPAFSIGNGNVQTKSIYAVSDGVYNSGSVTRNWLNGYFSGSIFNADDECIDIDSAACTFKNNIVAEKHVTIDSTIIHGEVVIKRSCEVVADEATIALPDATTQQCLIWVDGDNESAMSSIQSDGTVTIAWSIGDVLNTDTDGSLCIFDSGTGATIRNRLGGSKTVCYETKYSE